MDTINIIYTTIKYNKYLKLITVEASGGAGLTVGGWLHNSTDAQPSNLGSLAPPPITSLANRDWHI